MSAMTLRDDAFGQIASLMYDTIGIAFTEAKRHLVSSRLGPRILSLGLSGYDEYVALISTPTEKEELQVAIDLLTTNETYFFREPAHFELLERELTAKRPRELAIWSAAASYGDEAFSLAMLCEDLQRKGILSAMWSILGTDISDRVLRSASAGIYPEERLQCVSPDQLRRHCLRGEGDSAGFVQIAPTLRAHVKFGRLNLTLPIQGIGPFDVIFFTERPDLFRSTHQAGCY